MISYTFVIIASIVLLLIIFYHVFAYTTVFSKIKKTKIGRKIDKVFTANAEPKPEPKPENVPPDDDIHRFNELLDMIDRPVNTNDYQAELIIGQKPVVPTQSVVEVHIPNLAPPDQEGANSSSATQSTGLHVANDS